MEMVFLTTCSARKKSTGYPPVRISDLQSGTTNDVLREWLQALEADPRKIPVRDIYLSRSAFEMKQLSKTCGSPLYFISAGLGLVNEAEVRPLYDLTVSGKSQSAIVNKIENETFSLSDWWSGINTQLSDPICKLIRQHADSLILCALSASYFEMIRQDIEQLTPLELKRTRFFGIKRLSNSNLDASIMPYDHRLNGPDSPITGTLADFPQRCVVHYVRHVLPKATLNNDHQEVADCMASLVWPARNSGAKHSDDALVKILIREIKNSSRTKSQTLRHLRDNLHVACEQKRFSKLFNKAMKDLANENS